MEAGAVHLVEVIDQTTPKVEVESPPRIIEVLVPGIQGPKGDQGPRGLPGSSTAEGSVISGAPEWATIQW